MSILSNRYEFVLFFEVENGNPNGDPDAGNMPRLDPETGHGLVTDVCLKRKVRNYVELTKNHNQDFTKEEGQQRYNIYVQEKAVLNDRHQWAYEAYNLKAEDKKLPKDKQEALAITGWMCKNFYDVRTFGAVMSTKVNCGQVRGPVQFCFASSVEPIAPAEVTITRMAVTDAKEADKERTMGRKFIVPYGLYRAEGFISAFLAEKTGFGEADLELLWEALANMFEHDHSAARGRMSTRKLFIFKHDSKLGSAPSHSLFDRISCTRTNSESSPARAFSDYEIKVDREGLAGIELQERI